MARDGDGLFLPDDQQRREESKWPKVILAVFLIGFLLFVVIDSFTARHIEAVLINFLDWVEDNPSAGVFAVILVYMIGTGEFGWMSQRVIN